MGHGYFAVVANGILIDLKLISEHLRIDKNNTELLLSELEYADHMSHNFTICEKYIDISELKTCLSKCKFQFHYEDQYSTTNVFVTLRKKQIWMDTRGASGRSVNIDLEKLQLTEDEKSEINKLATILTGKDHQVDFMMYSYEGS